MNKNAFAKSWLPCIGPAIALLMMSAPIRADVVMLEDLPSSATPLAVSDPGTQWHGNDVYENNPPDYTHTATESSFTSNGVVFNNIHDHYMAIWGEYNYWDGWAYSNRCDLGSKGMAGQFTAMGSGVMGQNGALGSAQYGVASVATSYSTIHFDTDRTVESAYFTNTAYAYNSMFEGDGFAKKFGGESGNEPDWFKLTITGKNAAGNPTGSVNFYLANFLSANSGEDYIVNAWTLVNLSGLGTNLRSIEFALSSSDSGDFGMNTPAYFAMDNLTVVPEPSVLIIGLVVGLFAALSRPRRRRGA